MGDEQRGLKDRDLQRYYEELNSMFGSKGWEYFKEDLDRLYEEANKLEGVDTMEQLSFLKGERHVLKWILTQPAVVSAAYESALTDDNEKEDDGAVL